MIFDYPAEKYIMNSIIIALVLLQSSIMGNVINLKDGWYVQSSEKIPDPGNKISSVDYSLSEWYNASVPSTIMSVLEKNGVYKDLFYGMNLESVPKKEFNHPWWYRTEFTLADQKNTKTAILEFDGIVYRADVWLNGKKIIDKDQMFGVYRRFQLDVSNAVNYKGKNVLAIEIHPAKWGEPSIGFVDWNPLPPDNNMGIWREVRLKLTGGVALDFPFVKSILDVENFKTADLTVSAEVKNNTGKEVSGVLSGEIEKIKFSKRITLAASENKLVTFTPSEYSQLKINNPRVWWIHNWGKPELYDLKLQFNTDEEISDEVNTTFGIREVTDYINEQGHRGYKLNGRKILITGGGWVDQLFLDNDYKNLETQIQYVKHMGLNTIRLEGFWGNNEDMYDLCDKYGILLMAGYSCQWEWEGYMGKPDDEFGSIKTPEDMKLVALSWEDQIKWLRNHPSIFVWMPGSDKLPRPELEKEYLRILKEIDPDRPYLSSAKQGESIVSGRSAVKMNGPYEYVPPVYWSQDTGNGGAFGFNTETGPGPQVPPLESIMKMIPKEHLWPIDSVWDYHCGRHEFNNLKIYNEALNKRLGETKNLKEYVTKAQYMNYEGMRAMYEAFTANKPNATGIIQWMLNASWPKLWWQLYDYYLRPNAAYYGAKKALEPIHIQYNYNENAVYAVNNTYDTLNYLKTKAVILNSDIFINKKYENEIYVNLLPFESKMLYKLPSSDEIPGLTPTYFLALKLYNNDGDVLSDNFYSLSERPDVLDYEKTEWHFTPIKEFANLTGMNDIRTVNAYLVKDGVEKHTLNYSYKISYKENYGIIELNFKNKSGLIALQVELNLRQSKEGKSLLPIFWDDNYFTLLPGEIKTIRGYFNKEDLKSDEPFLEVNGWNVISD